VVITQSLFQNNAVNSEYMQICTQILHGIRYLISKYQRSPRLNDAVQATVVWTLGREFKTEKDRTEHYMIYTTWSLSSNSVLISKCSCDVSIVKSMMIWMAT